MLSFEIETYEIQLKVNVMIKFVMTQLCCKYFPVFGASNKILMTHSHKIMNKVLAYHYISNNSSLNCWSLFKLYIICNERNQSCIFISQIFCLDRKTEIPTSFVTREIIDISSSYYKFIIIYSPLKNCRC